MSPASAPQPATLVLPAPLRDRLQTWASARYPREACGVLVGRRAGARVEVRHVRELTNIAPAARRDRFELDPGELVAAEDLARGAGLEVVGVWHSHPDQPARPSEADRAAAVAGWCQVIVGVTAAGAGALGAWHPVGRRLDEMELVERTAE